MIVKTLRSCTGEEDRSKHVMVQVIYSKDGNLHQEITPNCSMKMARRCRSQKYSLKNGRSIGKRSGKAVGVDSMGGSRSRTYHGRSDSGFRVFGLFSER